MFIPKINTKLQKNDIVILIRDYEIDLGIFTKGHEFIIISECKDDLGYTAYNVIDNEGVKLVIRFNLLTKKLDYYTTKKIKKEQLLFKENLKLMSSRCKFKYNGIDDDGAAVYKCENKPHWCLCDPKIECNPNFWRSIKIKHLI